MDRRDVLLAAGVMMTALVVGCSDTDEADRPTQPEGSRQPSEKITADGEFGPVEVPANPLRVAGNFNIDADVALVLELPLIAQPGARGKLNTRFPAQQDDYAEQLKSVTKFESLPELNAEALAKLEPDLILCASAQRRYEQLSAIAPTLAYQERLYDDWREGIRFVANIFQRKTQAESFITKYDTRAAELKKKVDVKWRGATCAMLVQKDDIFEVYSSQNQAMRSMRDAGFELSPLALPTFAEQYKQQFSFENIDVLSSIDILLVYSDLAYSTSKDGTLDRDPADLKRFQESPGWELLPAVKSGQVYGIPAEINFASPLTAQANLNLIERNLLS